MASSEAGGSIVDIERVIQVGVRSEFAMNERAISRPSSSMIGAPEIAMPDYVEHRDGATEIGKLSAEAVVREYEATAKEIESMGADLTECVKRCEGVTRDALVVTKELNEVAARYRAEAKRVFEHIENCSVIVAKARKTCVELKDRMVKPITAKTEPRGKSK